MISHIWFQSRISYMQQQLKEALGSDQTWRVVQGPSGGKGGTTPDPYVGLVKQENRSFSVSAGCRNANSPYGPLPYAYVGVRAYPERGGRNNPYGTLQAGVDWCKANEHVFRHDVSDSHTWFGAEFQWALWKYVPTSKESDEYCDLLVKSILSLAEELKHL